MPQLIATSDEWQAKEILFLREILNTHLGSQATPPCASKRQLESCFKATLRCGSEIWRREGCLGGVGWGEGLGRLPRHAEPIQAQ